jgi:4-hydroxy-tetrahydrodipicolinate reductase
MGRMICDTIKQEQSKNNDKKIVCGISRVEHTNETFPIFSWDDMNDFNDKADVLIDFSHASNLSKIITYCIERNIPAVIGTTGFDNVDEEKIRIASETIPIFKSANMSIGINIVNLVLENIAEILFSNNFDIEILEKHHNKKVDIPSGTSLMFAETIKKIVKEHNETILNINTERKSQRIKNEIGIASIRCGDIVGEHSIIFAGSGESLEIKHNATSRKIFSIGALNAAMFITSQSPGLYSMRDLFKLKT